MALEQLLKFMVHPAISSINLTAALGSLATIARQRPMFMSEVIQAYETLHANLPPTLAKSQVSSVRKNLKLHLLSVLKHASSFEFHGQITTLLLDLGTQQQEIARNMPNLKDVRKRQRDEAEPGLKKIKTGGVYSKRIGARNRGARLTIWTCFCKFVNHKRNLKL
ncbi:UNVERIFIED_CONTAM: hypothetical protein FKN15_073362 [Acipenser sinensis]